MRIILLVIIMSLFFGNFLCLAQEELAMNLVDSLQLTIESDKAIYRVGEKVAIFSKLMNVGNQRLVIPYGLPHASTFQIEVKDITSNKVIPITVDGWGSLKYDFHMLTLRPNDSRKNNISSCWWQYNGDSEGIEYLEDYLSKAQGGYSIVFKYVISEDLLNFMKEYTENYYAISSIKIPLTIASNTIIIHIKK